MPHLPVHIISGFLGSGKTTAILQILAQKQNDEQWAIVINEFGKISIDSQTLKSSGLTGEIYEIAGGCICCSAKGYLQENLTEIVQTNKYARIIIEPSGLGGADMVAEIISSLPELILAPIICLVDILTLKNDRFQRLPVYSSQIKRADHVMFTKSDLLTGEGEEEQLVQKFRQLYPGKTNYSFSSGIRLNELILKSDLTESTKVHSYYPILKEEADLSDQKYSSQNFTFEMESLFDPEQLKELFSNNVQIVRAKGYIKTNSGWQLLNYTLSGFSLESTAEKINSELVVIWEGSTSLPPISARSFSRCRIQ